MTFVIELRRERDGELATSVTTSSRLGGRQIEVDADGRYWAALNLATDAALQRLARSTSSAGPLPRQPSASFVELTPGAGSRPVDAPSTAETSAFVDWTARKTDASSR